MSLRYRQHVARLAALVSSVLLTLVACDGFGTRTPGARVAIVDEPTWDNAIAPLFAAYCDTCHSSPPTQNAPSYLRTDTYESVGATRGAAALAARHLARSADAARPMPPAPYSRMTDEELAMLSRWVEAGTPLSDFGTPWVPEVPVAGPNAGRCTPGEEVACACPGGVWGRQSCTEERIFTRCDCGIAPSPVADAGTGADGGTVGDAGTVGETVAGIHADIFMPTCVGGGCHEAGPTGSPPDLETLEGLADRLRVPSDQALSLPLVEPGNPGFSYLYLKCRDDFASLGIGFGDPMPPDAAPLSSADLDRLIAWIAGGAR